MQPSGSTDGQRRPQSADIVIIGAGIIGASIAWHLASRGRGKIIVVDRGAVPGTGSTSRATGGFRAQFDSAVNIRLSLLSRDKLLRFRDEVGADPGYAPYGYLWIAHDDRTLAELRRAQELQHQLGLTEARMISSTEVREINPAVGPLDTPGGAFCPSDGFIRAMNMLEGYLAGAKRKGVEVTFGEDVLALKLDSRRRVTTVITSKRKIAAGVVVNAAGAWAAPIARMAGVDLPIAPSRRSVALTAPTNLLPERMPMTIFTSDGFHLRVRDGRVLLLLPESAREDPFDESIDAAWLERVMHVAKERVPSIARVAIDRSLCWSGLYEMSPDHHAITGPAPGVENFYLANGSSGHGVMHAPALGQVLSEMICDGRASIDVRALRPERFAEGDPNDTSSPL